MCVSAQDIYSICSREDNSNQSSNQFSLIWKINVSCGWIFCKMHYQIMLYFTYLCVLHFMEPFNYILLKSWLLKPWLNVFFEYIMFIFVLI